MSPYWGNFEPYVPVGVRRARGAREAARVLGRKGRTASPVVIEGRRIARTFWGVAWCENLERYSDFANRLPRGMSYARNGSVIDLAVSPGRVDALVAGRALYEVKVAIEPLPRARWSAIRRECAGRVGSLIELLEGRLAEQVMEVLVRERTGLFPSPKEIALSCSCPDWAYLCKHLAAVLYGVGARLDAEPGLLFTLRQVDQMELVEAAGSAPLVGATESERGLGAGEDLGALFGIELDTAPAKAATKRVARPSAPQPRTATKPAKQPRAAKVAKAAQRPRAAKVAKAAQQPRAAKVAKQPRAAKVAARPAVRLAAPAPPSSLREPPYFVLVDPPAPRRRP